MVNLHCAALYCHMPCLHYAVLLLSRAILTLCLILLSQAVLTLCHMLLSHAVLTMCRIQLIEFCGINNFVILFAYKEIHKLTWISLNQRDKKQIDHFLITGKWRQSLQNVPFRRGVDVGSNHHLVIANIKLQLKRTVTPTRLLQCFDVSKVKDSGIRPVVQY